MPTVEQDFRFHCAARHGADGKGRALKIEPPDLPGLPSGMAVFFREARIFGRISGRICQSRMARGKCPVWGSLFIGELLEGSVSVEDAQRLLTRHNRPIIR